MKEKVNVYKKQNINFDKVKSFQDSFQFLIKTHF